MSLFDFLNSPVEFARVLGLVVPLLVALVAKAAAPARVKAICNVALAALAGVTATLVGDDGSWAWGTFFNAWMNAFITGIVAYYGALKPTGLASALAAKTTMIGVGNDPEEPGRNLEYGIGIPGEPEPHPDDEPDDEPDDYPDDEPEEPLEDEPDEFNGMVG